MILMDLADIITAWYFASISTRFFFPSSLSQEHLKITWHTNFHLQFHYLGALGVTTAGFLLHFIFASGWLLVLFEVLCMNVHDSRH